MNTASPTLPCRLLAWSPPRWVLLVLVCLAIVARGRFERFQGLQWRVDPDAYAEVAANVQRDGVFGFKDRHSASRPTATRAPLYPMILFVCEAFDTPSWMCIGPFHVLLGVLTVCVTWQLGRAWGVAPGVSLIAAALVTIDPILLAQSVQLMTETLATFLVAITLWAMTIAGRDPRWRWSIAAGICGGLCVLCRPELALWLVLAACAFVFTSKVPRAWIRAAIGVAVACIVISPWVVRNYLTFGKPIATTTHGGYTLLLANNPDFYEYLRSGEWGTAWDGFLVHDDWVRMLKGTSDELAADRWAYEEAFKNIRAEPGMFLYSCLVRVGRLWAVLPHQTSLNESGARHGMRWAVGTWYAFEFVLAAAGAWFLRGRLLREPWLWATLLVVSLTLVHAFYWTDMRMRAPLVPVVALAAAYGLATLACPNRAATPLSQSA